MEPAEPEFLRVHHATLDKLLATLAELNGAFENTRRTDFKRALGPRFGAWMKEKGLPEPKGSNPRS